MNSVMKNYEKIKSYSYKEKGIEYLKNFEFLKSSEIFKELFTYYKDKRDFSNAEYYLSKLSSNEPQNLNYKLILSTINLAMSNFKKGFELFENRHDLLTDKYPKKKIPLWKGEINTYRKIVVLGEQGFGDCFMYGRFLKPLKNIFQQVDLCVSQPLLNIFKSANIGIDNIFTNGNINDYDCYCYIGSLPFLLGIENESQVSQNYDYLKQDILETNNIFKIGLCLHGRLDSDYEKTRAIDFNSIQDLFFNKSFEVHSLYKPEIYVEEYRNKVNQNQIIEHVDIFNDFNSTARLINTMDIIITSDTSIVHLAGSMGKKTLLLLPRLTDWRWKVEGESSYWYPGKLKIFRQEQQGSWTSPASYVIEYINKELKAY